MSSAAPDACLRPFEMHRSLRRRRRDHAVALSTTRYTLAWSRLRFSSALAIPFVVLLKRLFENPRKCRIEGARLDERAAEGMQVSAKENLRPAIPALFPRFCQLPFRYLDPCVRLRETPNGHR